MRGGIDVAGRVSARRLRVAPGLVRYRWRLAPGDPARTTFVLCVSLLPGTLVVAAGARDLLIHALDATTPVAGELAALEQHVAGLFALRLPAPAPGWPGPCCSTRWRAWAARAPPTKRGRWA